MDLQARKQLHKQQQIESWYHEKHLLIILPEMLIRKIILDYLIGPNLYCLTLTSFIKQFITLHGGNTMEAYKKRLIRDMKESSVSHLFQSYRQFSAGYTPLCYACEMGDTPFIRKFVQYVYGTEMFFNKLTVPGNNTQTLTKYCAFVTAIYFGNLTLVKYLLKVDESMNGKQTLLFHRGTKFNVLHVATYRSNTKVGFKMFIFLITHAAKHNAISILVNEVLSKQVGTPLDVAFLCFHRISRTLGERKTELKIRVNVIQMLKSLNGATTKYVNTSLDDLRQ